MALVASTVLGIAGVAIAGGGLGLAISQSQKKTQTSANKKQLSAALTADDKKIADLQAQVDGQAQQDSGTNWVPIVLTVGVTGGVALLAFLVIKKKQWDF